MVTYFNKKDLVDFGNYLLSDKRRELFLSHPEPIGTIEDRLKEVHHSDVENFLENKRKMNKTMTFGKWLKQFEPAENECFWYDQNTLYCIEAMREKFNNFIKNKSLCKS